VFGVFAMIECSSLDGAAIGRALRGAHGRLCWQVLALWRTVPRRFRAVADICFECWLLANFSGRLRALGFALQSDLPPEALQGIEAFVAVGLHVSRRSAFMPAGKNLGQKTSPPTHRRTSGESN
jgi:hypothetical protein